MHNADVLKNWLEAMTKVSYYGILRVQPEATPDVIKASFHGLSEHCHPDLYRSESPEARHYAGEVFKRVVEAYRIVQDPALREKYNLFLAAGRLRMDPNELPPAPKRAAIRTLEQVAITPAAKVLAKKADTFLDNGNLEAARLMLIQATQEEPYNDELQQRLRMVYEAMSFES